MITAVDTNVLLDVFGADAEFGPRSANALRRCLAEGSLIACEAVWAESSASFADSAGEALRRAFGVLKAFTLTLGGDGQWRFNLDLDAVSGVADSGDPEVDIVELLTEVGHAANAHGEGVLLLLDEMHFLSKTDLGLRRHPTRLHRPPIRHLHPPHPPLRRSPTPPPGMPTTRWPASKTKPRPRGHGQRRRLQPRRRDALRDPRRRRIHPHRARLQIA